MYIDCFINHGEPYLRVLESLRSSENGISKIHHHTVYNIGPLSKFDDGKPDYLKRLRKSFQEGHPLIESLNLLLKKNSIRDSFAVQCSRNESNDYNFSTKNIGYFLLDGFYDSLGIYDVMDKFKSQKKIEYDLNGITKLLLFGRILWPDSKCGTFDERDYYLFPVTQCRNLCEVYKTLDCLDLESEKIQRRINTKIRNLVGRNTEVCFYDVTNYYFEIEENDDDKRDKDGKMIQEGFRKRGPSKEQRKEPIVQMGLFIDDNGIPIAYRLFPGNHIDQTTLRPAMEKSIDKMDFGKVIIIADGGVNSGPNIAHILAAGNGYILAKSTKKSSKNVKSWILDEEGYQWNRQRTFKVKSKIQERQIKTEKGEKKEIREKIICYWSKKHYDRERKENKKFIDFVNAVIQNPDKLKDKPKKISKYLIKTVVCKKTGEVVNAKTCYSLNMDKIQEDIDLMGYYTILTSEVNEPDLKIIHKYHGLSRIEDSFRITKSDLEGRPIYVRKPEHINAHFLICFLALTMIRLIQYRVLKYQGKDTLNVNGWESGIPADRIQEALVSFQAESFPSGYYRVNVPNEDMKLILASLNLKTDLRFPTEKDLRLLKYSFDKSVKQKRSLKNE